MKAMPYLVERETLTQTRIVRFNKEDIVSKEHCHGTLARSRARSRALARSHDQHCQDPSPNRRRRLRSESTPIASFPEEWRISKTSLRDALASFDRLQSYQPRALLSSASSSSETPQSAQPTPPMSELRNTPPTTSVATDPLTLEPHNSPQSMASQVGPLGSVPPADNGSVLTQHDRQSIAATIAAAFDQI
jgi:hypothetical protein